MNRKLLQRVRTARTSASRTSPGRRVTDAAFPHGATGHGSRMPSQRATTRMQRPY